MASLGWSDTRPLEPQFDTSDGSDNPQLADWHKYALELEQYAFLRDRGLSQYEASETVWPATVPPVAEPTITE